MNSPTDWSAVHHLDDLMGLLEESRLQGLIDDPLDRAVESFHAEIPPVISHRVFHDLLAQFIQHVMEKGLMLPHRLSLSQALAEGIHLLDAFYPAPPDRRYETAYLEARNVPPHGFWSVLTGLVQTVKTVERSKYLGWVFAVTIDGLDWPRRVRLVQAIMNRYGNFMPEELRRCSHEQLISELPCLIRTCRGIEDQLACLSTVEWAQVST